jgi:hypothetical protein
MSDHFPSPLILGDDPIHGTHLGAGAGEDGFAPRDSTEFESNSPDTLQALATSQKDESQLFVSPGDLTSFQVSTSPKDGSFHEYSSDSAESDRKGDRASPLPPTDTIMGDSIPDQRLEGPEEDPFEHIMQGYHGSFLHNFQDPSSHDLPYEMSDAAGHQPFDFSFELPEAGTVTPADTLFNSASPMSEDLLSHHHNRQNSVRSTPLALASVSVHCSLLSLRVPKRQR